METFEDLAVFDEFIFKIIPFIKFWVVSALHVYKVWCCLKHPFVSALQSLVLLKTPVCFCFTFLQVWCCLKHLFVSVLHVYKFGVA